MKNDEEKPENDSKSIAIYILEKIKDIVLLGFLSKSETEKKTKFDNIYNSIKDEKDLIEKKFYLELWDLTDEFYLNLKQYFYYYLKNVAFSKSLRFLPKSSFAMNGIICLIELLLLIIKNDNKAYGNNMVKFNINILVEMIANKNKVLLSNIYFYKQTISELKNEFKDKVQFDEKNIKEISELNNIIKEKALIKFNKIKEEIFPNLELLVNNAYIRVKYDLFNDKTIKNDDIRSEKINKINNSMTKFINIKNVIKDAKEIIDNCKNDEDINFMMKSFLIILKKEGKIIVDKDIDYLLNNIVFQSGVFNIDLNDIENLYMIYDIEYKEDCEISDYNKMFYSKYLKMKEEKVEFENLHSYQKEIDSLIKNDKFMDDFYYILQSPSVSKFFEGKRKYSYNSKFETKFIDDKNLNDFPDDDLSGQFKAFIKDTKKNYNKFRDLIIFKQLGLKIHGAVDSNMRIFLNPTLYFSKDPMNAQIQKDEIIKSFLIVTLLHELTHLLKYYPIQGYPDKTPETPKSKENGQMITYFLFKIPVITKINYFQAQLINDIKVWNQEDQLKSIFNDDNTYKKSQGMAEIDLLLTYSIKEDKERIKRNDDFCIWEPLL